MKNLYRPMRTTLAAAMLIGGVMAAAPAQAQFEWMQKVAGVLNPRMAKLGEYNRLMSMHDYPAAAAIAEALVEEDLKASHSLMNSLNLNNSALQQSAGMAAQAQAKAKNYPRAIELLQMQIDAMPAILRRAAAIVTLQPKLELARLYPLVQRSDEARAIYQDLLSSPSLAASGMAQEVHGRFGHLALQERDWASAEEQLLLALEEGSSTSKSALGQLEQIAGIFSAANEMVVSINENRSVSDANGELVNDDGKLLEAGSQSVIAKELLTQVSPLTDLAELYWRTDRRDALADFYQGRFRSYAETEQARPPAPNSNSGTEHRILELRYARMGTLLAAAGLEDLATQALDHALQLNAERLHAMQRTYMPEALSASMRARRELLDFALSLQLSRPEPSSKDVTAVMGLALQSKGLHSELLAERVHAVALSEDPEVRRLWTRMNALQGQAPAVISQRAELSVQLQSSLQKTLSVADLGQGADFIRALSQRLQKASLLSVLVYTPFDFSDQEFSSPHYLGILLNAKDLKFADLGEVSAIDSQLSMLRADLATPPKAGARPAIPAASRKLYQQLLQPLVGKQLLAGTYLADLDGALGLLPLEALADGSGRYLIDSTEWRYLSSTRVLLRDRPAGNGDGRALVMASPGFDAVPPASDATAQGAELSPALRSMRFMALPETLDEGRAVAAALGRVGVQVELVSGDLATPGRLQASHGPRYLHIASHGFFLEEAGIKRTTGQDHDGRVYTQETIDSGLSSGIALAGANRGEGLLLTAQLRQLDLRGTELAVLSACETGVGSPRIGESMESLRQALEVAGAQTTVTSLWRVASAETRDTMAAFYDGIAKGRGKAAALRQAKLAIKNKQAQPFYWAPFIITGAD